MGGSIAKCLSELKHLRNKENQIPSIDPRHGNEIGKNVNNVSLMGATYMAQSVILLRPLPAENDNSFQAF